MGVIPSVYADDRTAAAAAIAIGSLLLLLAVSIAVALQRRSDARAATRPILIALALWFFVLLGVQGWLSISALTPSQPFGSGPGIITTRFDGEAALNNDPTQTIDSAPHYIANSTQPFRYYVTLHNNLPIAVTIMGLVAPLPGAATESNLTYTGIALAPAGTGSTAVTKPLPQFAPTDIPGGADVVLIVEGHPVCHGAGGANDAGVVTGWSITIKQLGISETNLLWAPFQVSVQC
jgi:hypothetical protein